jgi:hypothetical protein
VLVIDIQDVTHRMQATAATLAGLPGKFDAKGEDIFRAADAMDKIDPRLAARCLDAEKLREMLAKVAAGLSVTEIDVMAATALDPAVAAYSRFVWASTGPDHYALRVDGLTYAITANTLGTYTVSSQRQEKGVQPWLRIADGFSEVGAAFKAADTIVAERHAAKVGLIDAQAKWRLDGPTEKQIEWLLKKKIYSTRADVPAHLTKGQASQMLDDAFAKRGRR